MAWVWGLPREIIEFGADLDYKNSAPLLGHEYLSEAPVDGRLRPIFRSRNSLKRFARMHNPPIGVSQVVDDVWKQITLKFVAADRVQFLPIRLIARGEVCDSFNWLIPFDRVRCIDAKKSEVISKVEREHITLIYSVGNIVYVPKCLGTLHLARDEQMPTQMLISDELKAALCETGEDSAFVRYEQI